MTPKNLLSRKTQKNKLGHARSVLRATLEGKAAEAHTDLQKIEALGTIFSETDLGTYAPVLPLALNLNGRPYTLDDHAPFEPLFARHLTESLCVKSGRQVSKSTSQAARGLLVSVGVPYFTTLYVMPLYEQVRKFSTEYVSKFIAESPLRQFWCGTDTVNSVLHRSFRNFSKMYFSFAGTTADRIRGISAKSVNFDEVQDLDPAHLPIIRETMSASDFGTGISVYTGTPKTMDNTLEYEWQRSSQAEWCIPCPACRKDNIPALGYDLDRMIGPWHDGIGARFPRRRPGAKAPPPPGVPATVCARCRHWIDPRDGFWWHKEKARMHEYPGYHVPQIILPLHCEDPKRWAKLLNKRSGGENFTPARFYNEVLGESYDVGAKLVSESDLKAAATLPWRNNPRDPSAQLATRTAYHRVVMGVDWGGGGENEVSFTTVAILGLTGDGRIDVIYGERLLTPHDPIVEAMRIRYLFNLFDCQHLAHDYNGAGGLREVFLIQSGLDLSRIIPYVYNRTASKDLIAFHKSGEHDNSRNYWILDKARALQLVCGLIKLRRIRFFEYDYVDVDNRGLMRDFLALIENKIETSRAGEVYAIHRMAAFTDDFAHSVTFGACALWQLTGEWPNLPQLASLIMTADQMQAWGPADPWHQPDDVDRFFQHP